MSNVADIMRSLEGKMLGTIAWIATHSSQLSKIQAELESVRGDIADMYKQLMAIKEDVSNQGK